MLDKDFINERDRIIGVLPFYHIYGLVLVLHCSIYFGTQVYVLPRFNLETLCQTIQNNKITLAYLVPPILLQLAKNPTIQNYDLSSLREIMSGAAPLGDDLSKQLMARLPNAILRQSYGLTETSPAAVIEPTNDVVLGKLNEKKKKTEAPFDF
jgi:acyl-CoA synthetase (AMP-forming)/AMP-acid ligase II